MDGPTLPDLLVLLKICGAFIVVAMLVTSFVERFLRRRH